MSDDILINVTQGEVRVALLENQIVQEIHIERSDQRGLVGNIYKGYIKRILPGMQAAFVEIGLERAGFLHIGDLIENPNDTDIRDIIKSGQDLLVQVYKDPLGTKGARLTTQLTLPSRYLVLTPNYPHITVSQKITDENERRRLASLITLDSSEGYIFRTVAENINVEEVNKDKEYLNAVWRDIQKKFKETKSGGLVFENIPLILRVLRDLACKDVKHIRIDDEPSFRKMREYAQHYAPHLFEKIEFFSEDRPIFDIFSVEKEIQKALQRKVKLKSGGHLIFDQTEAMTTIDINTGSYLGKDDLEETIFKTNLEAAENIAWQVRLRNIGGIIIIDFIDMKNPDHRTQVLQTLMKALAKDSVRTEVSELSSLGLVQMTRKRTRDSLENILCVTCPLCRKRGSIKSFKTLSYEIQRELRWLAKNYDWPGFALLVHEKLADFLLKEVPDLLSKLKQEVGKPIELQVESSYTEEHFDILPLSERNKGE